MVRPSRPEQEWEAVTRLLVRQFARGSAGLVALLLVLLWILTRDPRLLIGTLVGSGWMEANGTALAWISARALRPGRPHGRALIVLLAAVVISLALMAWAVTAWRPS